MLSNRKTTPHSAELLRHFTPLDEAPDHRLEEIAREAEWLQARKKEVIMELGDTEESSIFLLKGNILLEAADGRKRIIKHTDPAANSPLSRLRPSRYRVTALTPVQYVKIDNAVLDRLLAEEEASELISSHYYVVEEGGGEEQADFASQALAQIYEDLHRNRLLLLSWQPAAMALTGRILQEGSDPNRFAELALLDPVLALKLLRRGGAGSAPPDRLVKAVTALGMEEARRLAFLNLFRESCRPHAPVMQEIFRNTWEQSIAVSRLAHDLAGEHGLVPVDSVALAGLLHAVGKLTIISYAYNFYREVSLEELKGCIRMFSRETGRMVLTHWNLPPHLVRGINDSFEWSREHGGQEVTLGDVLIAARLYTRLARKKKELKEVPALRKLGLQDAASPRGQALCELARQAVAEARELLGLEKKRLRTEAPETVA